MRDGWWWRHIRETTRFIDFHVLLLLVSWHSRSFLASRSHSGGVCGWCYRLFAVDNGWSLNPRLKTVLSVDDLEWRHKIAWSRCKLSCFSSQTMTCKHGLVPMCPFSYLSTRNLIISEVSEIFMKISRFAERSRGTRKTRGAVRKILICKSCR